MQEKRFTESAEGFEVVVVRRRRHDSHGPPRLGGAHLEGAGE